MITKSKFSYFMAIFLYYCQKMFATHSPIIVLVHNYPSGNALRCLVLGS